MARRPLKTLTEAESRIMEVLWTLGKANVRDVMDAMTGGKEQAYTTVQTFLGILKNKGIIEQCKDGRAFIYTPLLSRAEGRNRALKHLVESVFGGSTSALAQHLLNSNDFNAEEITTLEQAIDTAIEERDND